MPRKSKAPRLRAVDGKTKRAITAAVAGFSGELAKLLNEEEAPAVRAQVVKAIRPTASKTDLLLACPYPWDKSVTPEPVGERTRFGSAFHAGLELILNEKKAPHKTIAKRWSISPQELQTRLTEATPVVKAWLKATGNLWGFAFDKVALRTEMSVAYNPETGEAREIEGPSEDTHEYRNVRPGEIPGTADLIALVGKTVLVLDHKSGWAVAADWQPHTPAENGQLRTLATAFAKLYGATKAVVAFFHAPAQGLPEVYADEMGVLDFETHRKQLLGAIKRVGNGWLHPGEYCAYCPAWRVCPTNTTSLVELKRSGGPLTARRVGAIHQALGEYRRLAEKLHEEIRVWVERNGPGERADGSLVDLVDREVERLSKASILRAFGPLKGAKVLESLRAAGALAVQTERHLRRVDR